MDIECPRCGRPLPVTENVGMTTFQTTWKLSPCPDCDWTRVEKERALDAVFALIARPFPVTVEING